MREHPNGTGLDIVQQCFFSFTYFLVVKITSDAKFQAFARDLATRDDLWSHFQSVFSELGKERI